MTHRIGKICLITLAIIFSTGMAHGNALKVVVTEAPAMGADKGRNAPSNIGSKAVKAVDINNASKAELKTLQGVDDALAAKIIAGRPYPSKANLVTHDIIPAGLYLQLKQRIIAKQK